MRVKLIYRNYKPIHEIYRSFLLEPPKDVEYIIPRAKPYLRIGHTIYRAFGSKAFFGLLIDFAQNHIFDSRVEDHIDLIHYVQLTPRTIPDCPYVVDIEHVSGLTGFLRMDEGKRSRILNFITNTNCRRVIALSERARETLVVLLGKEYGKIQHKTEVVYPALPNFYNLYKKEADFSLMGRTQTFKLLFVGKDVYRKGLHELLEAFNILSRRDLDVELFIVSDAPKRLISRYDSDRIHYLRPGFSKDEIVKKCFIPSDLFVMPTHSDTFGMVLLDSLSSGTPVITTNQFACSEIIKDGSNGYLLDSDKLYLEKRKFPDSIDLKEFINEEVEDTLVHSIVDCVSRLYTNRSLLKKMSKTATEEFSDEGKFSIKIRNAKLENIYRDALAPLTRRHSD